MAQIGPFWISSVMRHNLLRFTLSLFMYDDIYIFGKNENKKNIKNNIGAALLDYNFTCS
jgi:hypothetical protein